MFIKIAPPIFLFLLILIPNKGSAGTNVHCWQSRQLIPIVENSKIDVGIKQNALLKDHYFDLLTLKHFVARLLFLGNEESNFVLDCHIRSPFRERCTGLDPPNFLI